MDNLIPHAALSSRCVCLGPNKVGTRAPLGQHITRPAHLGDTTKTSAALLQADENGILLQSSYGKVAFPLCPHSGKMHHSES